MIHIFYKKFLSLLHRNSNFFIIYNLLLGVGLLPFFFFDKVSFFLLINKHHHPFLDIFFYYITHLGSVITFGLLLVFLLIRKIKLQKIVIGASSFVMMSIVVQFLKRCIFPHYHRPSKLIPMVNECVTLHVVPQAEILTHLSFPSGHAATAFTAVCFLAIMDKQKSIIYNVFLLIFATLIAYSRVYLCQHFYLDIYIGALIGGWMTFITTAIFQKGTPVGK